MNIATTPKNHPQILNQFRVDFAIPICDNSQCYWYSKQFSCLQFEEKRKIDIDCQLNNI